MKVLIAPILCLLIILPILASGCSPGDPAGAAPPAVTVLPDHPSPVPEDENPVQTPSPTQTASGSKLTPGPTPTKAGKTEQLPVERRKIFMWIDGVPGDATEEKHKDWIEVVRYDLRIGGPVAPYAIGNEGPVFSKFTLLKLMDKASPKLALYVCQGTRIPELVIELCRGDEGGQQPYMRYRLSDAMVTRVTDRSSPLLFGGETRPLEEVSFSGGETRPLEEVSFSGGETLPIEEVSSTLPMEEVSFVYRTIEWTYFTLQGEEVSTGWNLAENGAL